MKWVALVLLLIQADCLSLRIFEKVEKIRGSSYRPFVGNLNECFAACYEDKNCTAIRPNIKKNVCSLYGVGKYVLDCDDRYVCYVLQRDKVDPVCKTCEKLKKKTCHCNCEAKCY